MPSLQHKVKMCSEFCIVIVEKQLIMSTTLHVTSSQKMYYSYKLNFLTQQKCTETEFCPIFSLFLKSKLQHTIFIFLNNLPAKNDRRP